MMNTHENDGSDWSYRMLIEDRYKRLAVMRRSIRVSAIVQLVYVCIRTLWHSIPFLTGETPLTTSTEYIFYAGVLIFLMRAYAFGFGKANREKLGMIMFYSVCSAVLTAEVIIVFFMYHVDPNMMNKAAGFQYPEMLAKHFAGAAGLSAPTIITIAQWFERALDIVGIIAGGVNMYVTKEYVLEKKEQRQEAKAAKEAKKE